MLEATLSVDPDHSYISLPSRTAVTLSQFNEALALVVHELETALETNVEFIKAINARRSCSGICIVDVKASIGM